MKRSISVFAGVVALITGAYFASQLVAQAPGATQQPAGTRVAVINIGKVFHEYVRAVAVKKELEELLKPHKDAAKVLIDQMNKWQADLKSPGFDPKLKDQYERGILDNKRKLEDLQLNVQKLVSKRQEDNLVTLWKEVKMGIDRVATTYGFQIVLAYGDPIEKEMLELFPNINRKMQAMDGGAVVPLYVHDSIDITPVVVTILNKAVQH